MTVRRHYADIAIITALPVEVLAALRVFDDDHFDTFREEATYYHIGTVNSEDQPRPYRLVISKTNVYGGPAAAALVSDVASIWRPQLLILAGIAGGLANKARLGDIIIADGVIEIMFAKFTGNTYKERPARLAIDPHFVDMLAGLNGFNWTSLINAERPDEKPLTDTSAHVGPIISSNTVVASDEQRERLAKLSYKPLAVEMEAHGVVRALIQRYEKPANCLVIKGISDYAGNSKSDTEWREYASAASIGYIRAFLRSGLLSIDCSVGDRPRGVRQVSTAEQDNWLGDVEYQQGRYVDAAKLYERAWSGKGQESNKFHRARLTADIAQNRGLIFRHSGNVLDAHRFTKIGLMLRQRYNESRVADSNAAMGLVTREYGDTKSAIRYLRRAAEQFDRNGNIIGRATAKRWEGYTYYTLGDYLKSTKLIYKSHHELLNLIPSFQRIPEFAESFDMLGRTYRQLSLRFAGKPKQLRDAISALGIPEIPKTARKLQELALEHYKTGETIARNIGDHFALAESYLSYVIFFYEYPQLPFYKKLGIVYWRDLRANYVRGTELATANEYDLLLCLYEKYMGNSHFKRKNYRKAFRHYAQRFVYSQRVRAAEQINAREEMTTKLMELKDDGHRRRCMHYFYEQLTSLAPYDGFTADKLLVSDILKAFA